MIKKFVCVLKSGGDYQPKQVINLFHQCAKYLSQMDEFICYTDVPINYPGVIEKPLIGDLEGRWNMQEVTRETGHVIATGLDILFRENLNWLWKIEVQPNEVYGMHAFKASKKWANGVTLWKGDWRKIYTNYNNRIAYRKYDLEQNWTAEKLRREKAQLCYLEDKGLKIASYKVHLLTLQKGLEDVDIVIFHGQPRPHNLPNESIIGKLYKDFD